MPHVQCLFCEDDLIFNPKLSHVVHRRLKIALKDFLWLKKFQALMIQWFLIVDAATGKITSSLDSYKKLGILTSMSVIDKVFPKAYHLCNLYEMKFEGATVIAVLDEAKVLESVYTNSEVYSRIGKEMCIVIDIAMSKGGTEAIVESFYSSMASQAMHGGQSNEALALRLVANESGRNKHINWQKVNKILVYNMQKLRQNMFINTILNIQSHTFYYFTYYMRLPLYF